jgi:hypothetical protein
MKVSPNPFASTFQIETEAPFRKAELFSLAGLRLGSYNQSVVLVDDLNSGVYLLKVTTDKGELYQRIVKEGF